MSPQPGICSRPTQVLQRLGSDAHRGLSSAEAAQRLQRTGPNEIEEGARRGPGRLLLEQFTDFMILVLLAAAVISGVIGDLTDTVVIVVIVFLNAIIGFVQAFRAERAIAALKAMAAPTATCAARRADRQCGGARAGARRCGGLGRRQCRGRRPALDRDRPAADGGGGPDRRVTHRGKARACTGAGRPGARRSSQPRLQRHPGRAWSRARRGGGYRHGHRAGSHRRSSAWRGRSQDAAAKASGSVRTRFVVCGARNLRAAVRGGGAARRTRSC